MIKEHYVSHPDDKHNVKQEIDRVPYPYMLITQRMPPQKEHLDEKDKQRKQQSYFFRSIVPVYARESGVTEEQARGELQIKFARTGEITEDESGEFDIVWLEEDKFRVFEQNKVYHVQSVASMSNPELSEFIRKSKDYLLMQFGVNVKQYVKKYKTKEL